MTQQTPLAALVDALASPREIRQILKKRAEEHVSYCLGRRLEIPAARRYIRSQLLMFLGNRNFSQYGRKRSLDRVISKALKVQHYRYALMAAKAEDERRRREQSGK